MDIYLDIDAHKVFPQALQAVRRHALEFYVLTRDYLEVDAGVHLILAEDRPMDRGRWIGGNIGRGDICITGDSDVAAGCVVKGAVALSLSGRPWCVNAVNEGFRGAAEKWPLDHRRFAECLEKTIAANQTSRMMSAAYPRVGPVANPGPRLSVARVAAG
jgi:hypothetical protein